jgi:hypothetical protein
MFGAKTTQAERPAAGFGTDRHGRLIGSENMRPADGR